MFTVRIERNGNGALAPLDAVTFVALSTFSFVVVIFAERVDGNALPVTQVEPVRAADAFATMSLEAVLVRIGFLLILWIFG